MGRCKFTWRLGLVQNRAKFASSQSNLCRCISDVILLTRRGLKKKFKSAKFWWKIFVNKFQTVQHFEINWKFYDCRSAFVGLFLFARIARKAAGWRKNNFSICLDFYQHSIRMFVYERIGDVSFGFNFNNCNPTWCFE